MTALVDDNPAAVPTVYAERHYGRAVAATEGGIWRMLTTADNQLQAPLIIRDTPCGEFRDAATPYGYGGVLIDARLSDAERTHAWKDLVQGLRDEGIVSAFFRFAPFLPEQAHTVSRLPGLVVEQVSETVLIETDTPDMMWGRLKGRARTAVRRAEKAGLAATAGPADQQGVAAFRRLYEQTMDRLGAARHHRHTLDYFEELLSEPARLGLVQVRDSDRTTVASCLVLLDEKVAHYHLSGSDGSSPGATNLLIWRLLTWAWDSGMEAVHLGGGLSAGDSLFAFKQSFGGASVPFFVGRLVVNYEVYERLCTNHARRLGTSPDILRGGKFFPAYRQARA